MQLTEMLTLRQPEHRKLREACQWGAVGILLAVAMMNMVRLARVAPHVLSLWLAMAMFAVAPVVFFVRAVRNPTDTNKQMSAMVSVCTMIFAGMPFAYILG
jgi:hypothetical protein